MHILTCILLIIASFMVGRIYEYRLQLKECENCDNIGGFKNES